MGLYRGSIFFRSSQGFGRDFAPSNPRSGEASEARKPGSGSNGALRQFRVLSLRYPQWWSSLSAGCAWRPLLLGGSCAVLT